ncbi:MAG TPA: choice-of-anchor B family protein, partial [Ignavibacteriaceae bacterium]
PGSGSIWRDIKTHDHYMYMVSEGVSGLQIVDLANLPNGVTFIGNNTTYFTTAHNFFIADGYAYIVGANNGSGIHILDLSNPESPVQTAYYSASGYVHDVYVYNDTAYASSEDTYDLVDVTDKSNPQLISQSAALPGIYAHSGWLTEDKRYFVACEEFNVRDITVWDLQDRTTWDLMVPNWQMTENTPVHNVFIRGQYAYISYYKDGFVCLDVSDPTNPLYVGRYDTYPGTTGTYEGAWGCYPFLPSGNVLISDISTGLYVLDFLPDNVPVELSSFIYRITGPYVELNWKTATEINNKGFEVQRSGDKNYWTTLDYVNGHGTTSEIQSYKYLDKNPLKGKSYYRIIQEDFDGTQKVYDPVEVSFDALVTFSLDQNYPNPFNPSTLIKYNIGADSRVNLTIYNALGQKVKTLVNEFKPAGQYEVNFDASGLSSGIYIARFESGTYNKMIKMSLLK